MDEEKTKARIGANIASYRKQAEMTQAGLAEKLNYSDKAVSKWERGDSIPDVLTMMSLAELFGITVNDLIGIQDGQEAVPEENTKPAKKHRRKADRNVILALAATLVWFVALLAFVVMATFSLPHRGLPFIYAIPVCCIVLLSMRSAWRKFSWNRYLISGIVWGSLLSVHLTILALVGMNVWRIYLLGIPGQTAIFLWFRMFGRQRPAEGEPHE